MSSRFEDLSMQNIVKDNIDKIVCFCGCTGDFDFELKVPRDVVDDGSRNRSGNVGHWVIKPIVEEKKIKINHPFQRNSCECVCERYILAV